MIRGVHHIGISVGDLPRAVAGFTAVAGFEPAARWEEPQGPAVLLRGVNGYLRVSEQAKAASPDGPPVNAAGITHFCAQGRAIEAVIAGLEEAGYAFPQAPVDLGTGFLYAYGRSPEGAVIEAEGAPFATAGEASWIGHVAFATHDLQRLSGFYAALLGGEAQFSPRLRNNPKYDLVTGLRDVDVLAAWVRGANIALEFWQYLNPATTPRPSPPSSRALGYSHVAFEVEDLAAATAFALSVGAAGLEPLPGEAGCESVQLRDPDGNAFRLVSWPGAAGELGVAALAAPDILAQVAADFDRRPRPSPEVKS